MTPNESEALVEATENAPPFGTRERSAIDGTFTLTEKVRLSAGGAGRGITHVIEIGADRRDVSSRRGHRLGRHYDGEPRVEVRLL
jgi:hypothetical protein